MGRVKSRGQTRQVDKTFEQGPKVKKHQTPPRAGFFLGALRFSIAAGRFLAGKGGVWPESPKSPRAGSPRADMMAIW